jgi:hypothetical protein
MIIYFDSSINKWVAKFSGIEAVDASIVKACDILYRMRKER